MTTYGSTYYQEYFGRFYLTSSAPDFAWASTNVTATAGYYFLRGYTGETQLLEHLQAVTRTAKSSSTLTFSYTNGRVVLADSGTFTVTWVNTTLRDNLGFTGNLSGANSYTATNAPRYVWRPTRPLSEWPGDLLDWWEPESTSKTLRANDGTTSAVVGTLIYDGYYSYQLLAKAEVITDSASTVWESFQQFWKDCIATPKQIRVFPDRTAVSSADYETGIIKGPDDTIGKLADFVQRSSSWDGLWDVSFTMWKKV